MPTGFQIAVLKPTFLDPQSFATTLLNAFVDLYGLAGLRWHPKTIRMELEDTFGFALNPLLFDRLMAAIAIVHSNSFYKSLPDFIDLCLVLSGAAYTPWTFQPADADDCAWGITEALLIHPSDNNDDDEPFTDEIRAYVGKVLKEEGIINPPDILRIALRDEDTLGRVQASLAEDDPEMSSAVWQVEASKTEDINSLTKERLHLLIQQLNALQLKNGQTLNSAVKLLKELNAFPAGGSPLA